MSPELGTGKDPFQDVIQGVFTHGELARLRNLGYINLIDGEAPDPEDQIGRLCRIAAADKQFGEGGLIRRSLDTAVAVAEGMDKDSADTPVFHDASRITPYVKIAKTAYRLGQGEDYARDILDKGVAVADAATYQGVPVPNLRAVQLELLAEAAYETAQGPDYIGPLVDRIWELNREDYNYIRDEKTVDKRIEALKHRIELARRYGLGDDYVSSAIEQTRQSWWISAAVSTETLNAKTDELARIALIASKTGQETDYTRSVIEEGLKVACWGADTVAFARLAEAAHLTEQPEKYIAVIIEEGFQKAIRQETGDPRDILGSLNQLLQALHGSRTQLKDYLQDRLAVHGVRLIEAIDGDEIDGNAARGKHGLLNTLLRGVELSETFMETNGIERRPLSYVFKPANTTGQASPSARLLDRTESG